MIVERPWHVVHVLGTLRVGGAERSVVNYLQAADREAFRHTVLCLTAAGELAPQVEALGVPVKVRPVRWRRAVADLTHLARWLRREKVAVVHSHLYFGSLWGRLAGLLAGVPALVTTEHGKELWKNRAQILLGRWLSRRTCRHIAVSEDGLRLRVEREGLDARKLVLIPNGVTVPLQTGDQATRVRVRRELGLTEAQPVIGTVGRTVEAKGYPHLLAAVARLCGERPDLRWLVVGDGPLLQPLLADAAAQGLAAHLLAVGQRNDVGDLLRAMDVFAMPSVREGLPVALLEAMAAGLPCVVSDVGGMPEALAAGEAGLVVPPANPQALAGALARLLGDGALRGELGAAAHARAQEHYGIATTARRIEDIYQSCLEGAMKPRICFVSMEAYATLRPGVAEVAGGAGFQLVLIAEQLRDRGYPVSFVTGDFGQPFREEIGGLAVLRANRVAHDRSYLRAVANIGRLARAMHAARADVYILRSTRFLAGQVWLLARLLRARYGFMIANMSNCLAADREGVPGVINRLYGASMRRGDLVTAQTATQQRFLREQFGSEAPLVPNGIAAPPYAGPRRNARWDVLWVGSLKAVKQPDLLLRIARRLPGRRFAVAGGPGQDAAYAARLADELTAAANVEYLGFVAPDAVGDLYAQSRIFLNTSVGDGHLSLHEGFPNTYLYAWSRGIPVASLHVDPDDVVQSRRLGVVDTDPARLAVAMDDLLADEAAYARAAKACHAHVTEAHSLPRTADALLAALAGAGVPV